MLVDHMACISTLLTDIFVIWPEPVRCPLSVELLRQLFEDLEQEGQPAKASMGFSGVNVSVDC